METQLLKNIKPFFYLLWEKKNQYYPRSYKDLLQIKIQ